MTGFRAHSIRMAGVVALVALVAAACGKSGGTGSGGTSATTTGGSAKETVKAANVSGLGMVLVDSRGFTLYHLEGETTSSLKCTGSCTSTWPPLKASGTPTGGSGASGTLATFDRSDNITQVTYDGLPLYTFAGDSGPGQSNGQGIQGMWFAVTPAGKSAAGTSGGSPSSGGSPTGGRYGY